MRLGRLNLPIAGGGYFRLLPYAWTRWGIARVNRGGEPVVFYIHPWEVDADQPRLPVGRLTAMRHYHGLDKTLERLETLFNDFAFDTVSAMLAAASGCVGSSSGEVGACRVICRSRWRRRASRTYGTRSSARAADAAGYHAWGWRRVFANAFGHEPVYLIARQDGEVAGVLPLVQIKSLLFGNTLTSLPFLNYGGVMADTADAADGVGRRRAANRRWRACRHVELRHVAPQFPNLPCKTHKVSMRLPLTAPCGTALDRKVRNQIRKAEKSGLVVERGGDRLVAISTRCSRATCAISAPRSIRAGSSRKCCEPFPIARNFTSCASRASRSPPA